jgi:hypothetical protein
MIEVMDYISEHLTSLRQEITDLRRMNARYAERSQHNPVEKTAFEVRQARLLSIKEELTTMLNCPPDPAVWWDKFRR